jgi:hypothetical protein
LALYRLVADAAGDWPATVASSLVWWGTMLGRGSPNGRTWSIKAAGRESWAYGTIGLGLPKEPLRMIGQTYLDANAGETFMRASLLIVNLFDVTNILITYVDQTTDSAALEGLSSYSDIAATVNTFLAGVAAIGGGASFDSQGSSSVRFSTDVGHDGVIVRWDREQDTTWIGSPGPWYTARLNLQLHEKVWRILGYEPAVQNSDRDPVDNEDQYGQFARAAEWLPGVWTGSFYAANARAMQAFEEADSSDTDVVADDYVSGGYDRRWPPIYPGGAQVLDMDAPGQEIQLVTLDPLYLPSSMGAPLMGQLDAPTSAYSIDGGIGDVTHQGIMLVKGPYRREGDEDKHKAAAGYAFPIERQREEGMCVQVARVCWRQNSDGSVAVDSTGYPRVVVHEWCEPRVYGVDFDRLTGTWASWRDAPADAIETTARPVLVLEHGRGPDCAPLVLAQLLASTGGAAGWRTDDTWGATQYGFGGSPDLEIGPNDLGLSGFGDERLGLWTDAMPARVGRRIPASLLSTALIEAAIADLAEADLARCKVVAVEPTSGRKLIAELLAPLGWAMSLEGGKLGIFDPWTFRAPGASGIVDSESYAADPGQPAEARPSQQLRELSPVDRVDVQAARDPSSGTFSRVFAIAATDPGAHLRAQTMSRQITAGYLVHPQAKAERGTGWRDELSARWGLGFRWWASAHFKVTFKVPAHAAGEFDVGSVVSLTDSWVVSPSGVYGVALAPGFVVSRVLDCKAERAEVSALISADDMLLYSPAAVVTRYDDDEDGEGFRLFVEDDAFGFRGGSTFDVEGFVEPGLTTAGGNALIELFAFDSVSWSRGIYGTVSSVNAAAGSCYILLSGALTGATFYRDRWHVAVLRNDAEQTAAWVADVFGPLCAKDGTSDGTLGRRFSG